jgi:hypothetical protein
MKEIFVVVDVGQEIDDEILLWWLQSLPGLSFTFIFSGPAGMSDEQCRSIWLDEYCPRIGPPCPNSRYEYITLDEIRRRESVFCDFLLLCASTKGYDGSNLTVRERVFLQGNAEGVQCSSGDAVETTGVNAHGSAEILERFRESLVTLGSSRCAQMRPTVAWLKMLPDYLFEKIWLAGFRLLLGRVEPGVVVDGGITLSKNIAAGLLNPAVGRAANYRAVEAFVRRMGHDMAAFRTGGVLYDPEKWGRAAEIAANYFMAVFETDELTDEVTVVKNSLEGPVPMDWQRAQTLECATLMNLGLELMAPGIWVDRSLPFYSSCEGLSAGAVIAGCDGEPALGQASDAFLAVLKEHIMMDQMTDCRGSGSVVGYLNPVYDLYAGYVMMCYLRDGDEGLRIALEVATPEDVFTACMAQDCC